MTERKTKPENRKSRQASRSQLDELLELALAIGSDDAVVIPADKIKIEAPLADLCRETRCPNYGLSPTCPPHVEGPNWLQNYLPKIAHALLLKIEVDQDLMYSDQRTEIGKLLHFIVIQIENHALEMGLTNTRAFAGGSCKNLFCSDHYFCQVLEGSGECRNPDHARPSISGYGININHLLTLSGWSAKSQNSDTSSTTSCRYGLIFLG